MVCFDLGVSLVEMTVVNYNTADLSDEDLDNVLNLQVKQESRNVQK